MPNLFKEPIYTIMRGFIKHVLIKTKSYKRIANQEGWGVFLKPTAAKRRYLGTNKGNSQNDKVLYVYNQNFFGDDTGAKSYALQIVKALKNSGCIIDLLSIDHSCDEFSDFDDDNTKNGEIINTLHLHKIKKREFIKCTYSPFTSADDAFIDCFQQLIRTNQYRVICVHGTNLMDIVKYSSISPHTKIIGVMDEFYAVHSFNWSAKSITDKMSALAWHIASAIELMSWCDDVLCISADEKRFMEKFHDRSNVRFHFLPYFIIPKKLFDMQKDIDCLFVGNSNPYNRDAWVWFIDEVLPLLKNSIKFTICGKVCEKLQNENSVHYQKSLQYGMKMLGFIDDLDAIHARSKISLAPIFAGAGLKIKTINSMACGVPVVATDWGVDGFLDKTENGCIIANTPAEFAGSIMRLLEDRDFYANMVGKCKSYFEQHFSYDKNSDLLGRIFLG